MDQQVRPPQNARLAIRTRRSVGAAIFMTFLLATGLQAQSTHPPPQPVKLPAPVDTPNDKPYSGVIQLHIDATDVLRRIYQIHEIIPVRRRGTQTFLFPQWKPGGHAPNEALEKLAGLVITASGSRLHWQRDPVNAHAFSVEVPGGPTSLDLRYQYRGSTDVATGPVLITPTMLYLQWQSVILYPAGHFSRAITYQPSVTLPHDALIDQPLMAGLYLKQISLSSDPVPVCLTVAVQDPADLAALPASIKLFTPLMQQASRLFGSRHYDHYYFLLFVSDEISTYFEHHRSGEGVVPASYFKADPQSRQDTPTLSYLAHGYVHSWNGMYRRPAEMWTPNLNTPERDSMLWVFEGLTEYWANVLCARAGVLTHETVERLYTDLAASMTLDSGADWRPLQDTNYDPIIIGRNPTAWPSWQRNLFDAYNQGQMIWLEADAIIRQQSSGTSLTSGETIVSVNGKPYDPELFVKAIHNAAGAAPLDLLVTRGAWQQAASIEWHGGMRYPHLQRVPDAPAILDEILARKS